MSTKGQPTTGHVKGKVVSVTGKVSQGVAGHGVAWNQSIMGEGNVQPTNGQTARVGWGNGGVAQRGIKMSNAPKSMRANVTQG